MMEFNNTRRSNFLGHDGFVWWVGVVENRMDPLNLGRCKVRIKGLHSEKTNQISSESLPWAQPLFPINNSFTSPSTLKEGDMVVGFFMDGDQAQYPVILGMFHGIPEDKANPNTGFNDQRTAEELKNAPRPPEEIKYKTDGTGVEIKEKKTASANPQIINEPTTDRFSRNENIDKTIVKAKQDSVVEVQDATGGSWSEPETPYKTTYPYNKVMATESGHFLEFDDTFGSERIHLYHRSGSFSETHQDGSKVDKVVKNKYSITMEDDHVYIMGDCSITVQGNAKIYVKKQCDLKVDQDLNFNVLGNWNATVKGNINFTAKGSWTSKIGTSISFSAGTTWTSTIGKSIEFTAGTSWTSTIGTSIDFTAGISWTSTIGASIDFMAGASTSLISGGDASIMASTIRLN